MKPQSSSTSSRGFSLVEMIITVASVAILAGIAYTAFNRIHQPAKNAKLENNVATLNRAVAAYLASGGDLSEASTPAEVIDDLKTVASGGDRIAGYRGSFVDPRLEVVPLQPGEDSSDAARVVWDTANLRFAVAHSGGNAVADFRMNEALAAVAAGAEDRENPLALAGSSKWVWDFSDNPLINSAPDGITNGEDPETGAPTDPAPVAMLQPPAFTINGGTFGLEEFPLTVSLVNPNDLGYGTVMYAINGGSWQAYTGEPIAVQPNEQISAYVAPSGPGYMGSAVTTQIYRATQLAFSGEAHGAFVNPAGADGMVVHSEGGLFEWGSPVTEEGYIVGSQLNFQGAAFSSIQPEQLFRLGTLEYFNSTIWMGSEAWNVTLDLNLNLTSPAISTAFSFDLELINTVNLAENTADQNADYVRLSNPTVEFSTSLNGQRYYLQLAFGYLGLDGFASVDQFHVHEGSHATADLWGKFLPEEAYLGQTSQIP